MTYDYIEIILSTVLIAIYAHQRFNTPATVRTSTTACRYYSASAIYLMIYLLTFFLLYHFPQLRELLERLLQGLSIEIPEGFDQKTPMYFAILLSVMIPKLPGVKHFDHHLRMYLHRLAAIPYEAIRLSKELQQGEYRIPGSMRDSLLDTLQERGFERRDIDLDSDDSLIQRWAHIASLMQQLRLWEQDAKFSAFVIDREQQYERIKEHYKRITEMARNAFVLFRQAGEQPGLEPLQEANGKFRTNLYLEEKAIYSEICDFISHGILKSCFSYGARRGKLMSMGFQNAHENRNAGFSINHTIVLFALLLVMVMTTFSLFRPEGRAFQTVLLISTMIVSIYSTAVVCAILPKRSFSLFQYAGSGFYPAFGYTLSGVAAALFGIGISLFFKTLIFATGDQQSLALGDAFDQAWGDFAQEKYPWTLMSFATAAATAFLIDWRQPAWLAAPWRRFAEAGILAGVLAVIAASLVHPWLTSLVPEGGRLPRLEAILAIQTVAGLVIGYFVPNWHRQFSSTPEAADVEVPDDHDNTRGFPTPGIA